MEARSQGEAHRRREGACGRRGRGRGRGGEQSETWTVRNTKGMPHNFHAHDVQFRAGGERRGAAGRAARPRDTVFVPNGIMMKLAMRFDDGLADPDTPYMYHCHRRTQH
ncbi:multicopper oxidase domain-containing protein [Streptomyces sp. NPDC057148]|uniref:multicopper oxidase domain-containing protein n=1 Tax=unclassified Streptomyces TaxID=2593676 RepID=UPI003644A02B